MRHVLSLALLSASLLPTAACGLSLHDAGDDADATFAGKADAFGLTEGSPEALGILRVVNEHAAPVWTGACGVSRRTARHLTAFRDGPDRAPATMDDRRVATLAELDAIPYVGPIAAERLLGCAYELDLVPQAPWLLRYSHGNQIYASELTLYLDGTGALRERATPVDVEEHALPPLAPDELADLTALIAAAASAPTRVTAGALTSLGSTTTELVVYAGGAPTIITRIDRDDDGDGRDQVVLTLGDEAEAIRTLVDAYVVHDVPR